MLFWGRKNEIPIRIVRAPSIKDHLTLGQLLGQSGRSKIQEIVALAQKSSGYRELQVRNVIPPRVEFLKANFPDLLNELIGLSEGAGVDLEPIMALNFFEDIIWESDHCSLIFRKSGPHVLMGWNEDGASVYLNKMSLVRALTPTNTFLTLNYPGLLWGDTMAITSAGLVLALQSLNLATDPFDEIGLPRGLAGRLFLDCQNLEEVLALAKKLTARGQLAHGFHLFVYDAKNDKIVSIEFHPRHHIPWFMQIARPTYYAHTNHYLFLGRELEPNLLPITPSSRARLAYLDIFKKSALTPKILADVLSDRPPRHVFSGGESICREGLVSTLHSQVVLFSPGGPAMLWTSPTIPSRHSFSKWRQDKFCFD